jgi:phosphoribosylformimino-5-aminoimidazole carboxamide ribotide isomerase
MELIPAIDLKDGGCVRLFQGRFDAVTEYPADPVALALRYAGLGARWVHCVDLDGARDGAAGNLETIRRISAELPGRLQVGGGIRDRAAAQRLLDAGVGRVVIGSVAAEDPPAVIRWLGELGPERLVLALDVSCEADEPMLVSRGWTERSEFTLWQALDRYGAAGARHVLCTDVSRDGAFTGPAVDLYRECAARFPSMCFQASGGVRHVADLESLAASGAGAAIVGRALLEGRISEQELQPFLRSA